MSKKKTFSKPIVPVVVTYSFDDEVPIYLYESDKEAEDALYKGFLEEVRIEKEENERTEGIDFYAKISDDHRSASITVIGSTGEDVTEWRIGCVYND